MKIAWVVEAWPPAALAAGGDRGRGAGGDAVESAARELARRGDEVVVVAGAVGDDADSNVLPVHVLARADLHHAHWQRSASVSIRSAFRAFVREMRPDLVHVHHWRGLSRDLVHAAALEGRPAVVSLHDLWSTCLIHTRILPVTHDACDAPFAARPCLACAARVPPLTPWVPIEAQHMAFAAHKNEIVRELRLARAVLVRDRALGAAIRRFLGEDAAQLAPFMELTEAHEYVRTLVDVHSAAVAAGPPEVGRARGNDWYTERMQAFAESEWERHAQALRAADSGATRVSSNPDAGRTA